MRVAIIDLGTNSVRLHILEKESDGSLKKVFKQKEMIQLGAGLFKQGDFSAEARERTLKIFMHFQALFEQYQVTEVQGVATCAMREAKSGALLRDEIEELTGIRLRIISGEDEAMLLSKGIIANMGALPSRTLLVDIGGGSTECSLMEGIEVLSTVSTPLGAVRCQEETLLNVPTNGKQEALLRERIRHELEISGLSEACHAAPIPQIIGSSGSIRAILRLIRKDEELPLSCSQKQLSQFTNGIRELSIDELLALGNIEPKRASILFSATVILEEIALHLKVDSITAVSLGLKDGLLALIEEDRKR
jgi:exopolyphosphatase/guanosine-5'-triphosphate,3'-diphosphate pyrophosphatase